MLRDIGGGVVALILVLIGIAIGYGLAVYWNHFGASQPPCS
jgi:hypothetical protein